MTTLAIFRKELTDALRDHRSLLAAALTMLAGPLLVVFALVAVTPTTELTGPFAIDIRGAEHAADLVRFLEERGATHQEGASPRLTVAGSFAESLAKGDPAELVVEIDTSLSGQSARAERLITLLRSYAAEVGTLRLLARGVDPIAITPVDIQVRDAATISPRTAVAIATMPMFLVIATFLGCMHLAIDATAGERERRTLEALLAHAVSPRAIATGKWLVTFLFGAVSACGMLAVLRLVFELPAAKQLPIQIDVSTTALVRLAVLLIPLAALAAAAQLFLALRSKSFKEAQTQLSLLLLAPMVPGFMFAFDPPRSEGVLMAIPIVGHQLLASRVLGGASEGWLDAGVLGLACFALAALFVTLLAKTFANEDLLQDS